MRKNLFALLLGLAVLASCSKENELTRIRHFDYAMGGKSMYTKTIDNNDVLDAINATLPESVSIYLTSESTGKMFQGKTGEGIVLPSDSYKVVGSHNGVQTNTGEITSTKRSLLTSDPSIDISETITVTDEETSYTLHGTYKSFALVVDSEEVEKATVTTKNGEEEIKFLSSGTSRIVFGQGNFSNYLVITVHPVDKERYKTTTFTLSTTPASGTSLLEVGKFYVLHPTADGEQPKVLGLELPNFTEGTL